MFNFSSHRRRTIALAATFSLTGCAGLVGGMGETFTSDDDLAKKGAEAHQHILEEVPLYAHGDLGAYVDRVGQRLVKVADPSGKKYCFYVLDTDDTNAFSVPGGYVYINRGMLDLMSSEDELAVTLGHEIGHLVAKHSASRTRAHGGSSLAGPLIQAGSVVAAVLTLNPLFLVGLYAGSDTASNLFADAMTATYGRTQEFEADRLGMMYAAQAGYQPRAAARVISTFQNQAQIDAQFLRAQGLESHQQQHGIFESHPDNEARVATAKTVASQIAFTPKPPEADFLGELNGTLYGESKIVGVERQGQFFDGDDKLVMTVPDGWFVLQSGESHIVIFNAPKSAAQITLVRQDIPDEMTAEVFVKTYVSGAKLVGSVRTVAGQKAWVGTAKLEKGTYQIIGWTGSSGNADYGYLVTGWLDSDEKESPSKDDKESKDSKDTGDSKDAKVSPKKSGKSKPSAEEIKQSSEDAKPTVKPGAVAWPQVFHNFEKAMRALRPDETALTNPPTIAIVAADGTKRYRDYAKGSSLGPYATPELKLLNGQYLGGEPEKGQRLKLVN